MSNLSENRLNTILTNANITAINSGVTAVLANVPPITLTDEQRNRLLGMDVENKVFAEDAMNEIGISGAGIIPPFITAANLQNDLTLFAQLDVVEANLLNALQRVQDAKRLSADEAMTVANAVYKMFEMAHFAGIPGGTQGYEKLKERYRKSSGAPVIDNP